MEDVKQISVEDKKAALKQISDNLQKIDALYSECERIALGAQVDFSYSGPAGWGDGGDFYCNPPEHREENWIPSSTTC